MRKGEFLFLKIESYEVRMDSVGARSSGSTRKFSVGCTVGSQDPENSRLGKSFSDTLFSMDREDGKDSGLTNGKSFSENRDLWSRFGTGNVRIFKNIEDAPHTPVVRDIGSVRQQFVLYLWRLFFGDESAQKLSKRYGIDDMSASADSFATAASSQGMPYSTIRLYGIEEQYSCEVQKVSFRSSGTVTTADGRTSSFRFDFDMSSRFEQYYMRQSDEIISMCDPLVLNFAGDIADLSDQTFSFDLDCDGNEEEISLLKGGNGFLSLDVNKDGVINNGSELFGTSSGDGFADLAVYDLDANGWIDENDDIFDRLKIWYRDDTGSDKLLDLKEAGVGAIYLDNAAADFNLRSSDSFRVTGAIRRAGIFLYENAMAGSIVHLDMAN